MADHCLAAAPRLAVDAEQRRGIDLERSFGMHRDVSGRNRARHRAELPQQQPARLVRMPVARIGEHRRRRLACNRPPHDHIGYGMGDEKSIVCVDVDGGMAGWRLDRALAALVPTLSRERLKGLISNGDVAGPAGLSRDPAKKVAPGEAFTVTIPPARPSHSQAQDIPLVVVFEDDHLLIVDKPAGLVVHPAAGNLDGTLVNALLHHCAGKLSGIGGVARPGIVHRIDKDTSGLLVVAKTDPAHEGLSRQFAAHSVERVYTAIVAGVPAPSAGRIEGALARSSANRQKMAIVADGRGKHAVTHFRTVKPLLKAAQIECRLETGRTHQIRVHMASIGHPLLGDPFYGGAKGNQRAVLDELNFRRQALHAATLGFIHPITQAKLSFASALPVDIVDLIGRLSVDDSK